MIDAGGLCSPIQFLLLNHNNTIMSQVPWNFVGRRLVPLCSKRPNWDPIILGSLRKENYHQSVSQFFVSCDLVMYHFTVESD